MNKLLLASLLLSGAAMASPWEIDATHSTAQFGVRHMMVSTVRGQFSKVAGKVDIDDADLTKSSLEVNIDPASIDTREPKRDAHLKGADFLDVAQYPAITYKSTKIEKAEGGKLLVTGNLTMHGVTKPVTLTVDSISPALKNPWGQTIRGVSATGKLNRKDFGLKYNQVLESGGALVGDEVQLQIDAELVQAKPAAKS